MRVWVAQSKKPWSQHPQKKKRRYVRVHGLVRNRLERADLIRE